MCILFMYVANSGGPYKLIIASNRDEKYSRPTAPAKFWGGDEDSHILAGQDLEEFGTWLGISKKGKLAILLNIMAKSLPTSGDEIKKVSRGGLVTSFLRSPWDLPGCTYLKNLCKDPVNFDISKVYNPFHLITVDLLLPSSISLSGDADDDGSGAKCDSDKASHSEMEVEDVQEATRSSICVTYLSNMSTQKQPESWTPPPNHSEIYALGNNRRIDKPFEKVARGQKQFEKLVQEHLKRSDEGKDYLAEDLLQFLRSEEKCQPDDVLGDQGKEVKLPEKVLQGLSSIFVKIPEANYGTRTHTVILIDFENNVSFYEWTMASPINPNEPEWSHVKYEFKVGL